MPRPSHAQTTRPASRGRSVRRVVMAAAGLTAVGTLGGCSLFEEALPVTYELGIAGTFDDEPVRVEYLGREWGLGDQETEAETVPRAAALPRSFETLAQTGDSLSITAAGLPGALLSCEVLVDGEVVDQQESPAPGEDVTCEADVPQE